MDPLMSVWPFFSRYGYAILFFGIALENAGLPKARRSPRNIAMLTPP